MYSKSAAGVSLICASPFPLMLMPNLALPWGKLHPKSEDLAEVSHSRWAFEHSGSNKHPEFLVTLASSRTFVCISTVVNYRSTQWTREKITLYRTYFPPCLTYVSGRHSWAGMSGDGGARATPGPGQGSQDRCGAMSKSRLPKRVDAWSGWKSSRGWCAERPSHDCLEATHRVHTKAKISRSAQITEEFCRSFVGVFQESLKSCNPGLFRGVKPTVYGWPH